MSMKIFIPCLYFMIDHVKIIWKDKSLFLLPNLYKTEWLKVKVSVWKIKWSWHLVPSLHLPWGNILIKHFKISFILYSILYSLFYAPLALREDQEEWGKSPNISCTVLKFKFFNWGGEKLFWGNGMAL